MNYEVITKTKKKTKGLSNKLKSSFTKSLLAFVMFAFMSTSLTAQNNVKVKAEQTKDGVKITTTENGNTSSKTYNLEDAKNYLKQIGDKAEIDIVDSGDNNYKIVYKAANGETETMEVNVDEILENIDINFENLELDLDEMLKKLSSIIDYEETIDKDGNKTINIKKAETK